MKRILSIQDLSCVGQCSTTVALPLVSACGVECAVLPPAILSNHTAPCFSGWTFRDLTDDLPKIEAKWIEQGVKFDAFYTGYVCESHIDPILSIMETCGKPGAMRIVDPAMADDGELYRGFAPDFPSKIKRLVEGADYILPNMTEAALLVGDEPKMSGHDREDLERLISRLHALGARNVVLTGVTFDADSLGTAVSDGSSVAYDFNRRLSRMAHGFRGVGDARQDGARGRCARGGHRLHGNRVDVARPQVRGELRERDTDARGRVPVAADQLSPRMLMR